MSKIIDKLSTIGMRLAGIFDRTSRWGAWVAGFLTLGVCILTQIEILLRDAFGISTLVADDISSLAMVGIIFLPLAYTQGRRGHANFTIFHSRLSPRGRAILDRAIAAVGTIFVFALLPKGIRMMARSYMQDLRSTAIIGIPLFIPQALLVVGILLFGLQFLAQLIRGR